MILQPLSRAKANFQSWLRRPVVETLSPPPPDRSLLPVVRALVDQLAVKQVEDDLRKREIFELMGELQEAALMGGSGPWLGPMTFAEAAQPGGMTKSQAAGIRTRESFIGNAQGANGLLEIELNNWEWRREISFGWLEFSRWGIQQIILLSRLYYIKNPIVRRLVNVCAIYVFGRGVEISSPDQDANDEIKRFLERNQKTLGQVALTDLERRKDYDGNLFFAFFTDQDKGDTDIRTIDATEMQEIVTDPDDADTELLFKRQWIERKFDAKTGSFATVGRTAWYPSLNHWQAVQDGAPKDETINSTEVMWGTPIYHRKCGTAGKWLFGCPRIYPMIDWAKEARKMLERCATVAAALAQIAMTITTKGGQQALEGIKQQLGSTVGTGNDGWYEKNPTAVPGSTFASGPGTKLEAFKTAGAGPDPDDVRQYKLMCCMVKDVPETFLGDVSTGNLATATTLDRPTELAFKSLQEEWIEDLVAIVKFALRNSLKATNGRVREAMLARKADLKVIDIREAKRQLKADGTWKYIEAPAKQLHPDAIEVTVTFPSIREGDIPQLVTATATAMTLGGMGGTVTGIDQKAGVFHLMTLLGIDKAEEIVEEMFPEAEYDPNRTEELAAAKDQTLNPPSDATPSGGVVPGEKPAMIEAAIGRLTEALAKWRGNQAS